MVNKSLLKVSSMSNTKKITLAGILIAVGVICSPLSIPVGFAKCFPIQHAVNIVASVILGPAYAVGMAFCTSLIRVLMGTGSLLAFPGSMVGALLAGILYKYSRKTSLAAIGEVIGTGIIGALIAYPVAAILLGKEVALFAYVIPFSVSSFGGTIIAVIFVSILSKFKILKENTINV